MEITAPVIAGRSGDVTRVPGGCQNLGTSGHPLPVADYFTGMDTPLDQRPVHVTRDG
jgi:hypothetical protein